MVPGCVPSAGRQTAALSTPAPASIPAAVSGQWAGSRHGTDVPAALGQTRAVRDQSRWLLKRPEGRLGRRGSELGHGAVGTFANLRARLCPAVRR